MTPADVGVAVVAGALGLVPYALDMRRRRRQDDDLEAAHAAYVDGRIDEDELERRLELAVDDEAARIRESVEEVSGVGPATSAALALRFDTLEDLREASRRDLEAVHGVGPSTVSAIRERYGLEDEADVDG